MAKNNKNKIEAEPVAKCDQSKKVVAKCDLKSINIESLIRTIRGQKVMVDFDLAMLYGVLNKRGMLCGRNLRPQKTYRRLGHSHTHSHVMELEC